MASLLPTYVDDHHPKFNSLMVGILLASYQFSAIVTAPILGMHVGKIGRNNAIVIAQIIMTFATTMFAIGGLFEKSDASFYTISMFARLF